MKRNAAFALLVLAVTLALSAALGFGAVPARAQDDAVDYSALAQSVSPEGFPIIGDEAAPITLVEFSNFSCPGCAAYHTDVTQMIGDYVVPGQARFMYVPMIFGFGDDPSYIAAQAALCAADQGKFWEMHDALFAIHNEQGAQVFNLDIVRGAAESLALDVERLAACVGVSEKADVIDAAIQLAGQVGVQYTPTLTLSMDGGQTIEWFAQADGAKFDSSVPVETVGTAVTAAANGEAVASWQQPDPFAELEYTPWRSADNMIEMEHPTTWTAEANPRGGPLSYYFIQSGVDDTGISLLVLPYRALFETAPTETDPKALLALLFPDTPAEDIREVTAGDLSGAAVTITSDGVTRDVWLLPIGGDSGAIIQGITTEALWPQMEPIVQHAAETLRIDAENAIAQLDMAFPRPAVTIPLPDDAESFQPRNVAEGPCVGVADPTDVTVPADGGTPDLDRAGDGDRPDAHLLRHLHHRQGPHRGRAVSAGRAHPCEQPGFPGRRGLLRQHHLAPRPDRFRGAVRRPKRHGQRRPGLCHSAGDERSGDVRPRGRARYGAHQRSELGGQPVLHHLRTADRARSR